jgi:glycosyltransferase involved in cell wall biosynthesis
MKAGKVCIVRGKSPPEPEPRITKTAMALKEIGWGISLVEWDRSSSKCKKEVVQGLELRRINLRAPENSPSLAFFLPWWWIRVFVALVKEDPDVFHACDFDTLAPCVLLRFLKGKRVVYDQFDSYANMIEYNIPHWVRSIIDFIEKWFADHSDLVILADESRKNWAKKIRKKVVVVENTPPDLFLAHNFPASSAHENEEREERSAPLTIFYGGNLVKTRGLGLMASLADRLEGIRFRVAGWGPDEDELIPLLKSSKNVDFLGPLSYDKLLHETAKADVIFAAYDPQIKNNRFASPNKLFEAMMCARPVIVARGTNADEVVEKERCGFVIEYENEKELAKVLKNLQKDRALGVRLGMNGRKAYLSRHNWAIMKKRIQAIYAELD